MRRGVQAVLLASLAVMASACAPTLAQTARTNGAGRLQVALEPGMSAIGFDEQQSVLPSLDVSARYGVTDGVDVGFRFGQSTAELQTKIMLTDPSVREGIAVSVAPTLSILVADALGLGPFYGHLSVPVLADVPVGPHRFVGGARLIQFVAPGESGGANLGWQTSLGVSAGFALALGSSFQLLPEVGFDLPVLGKATALPGPHAPRLGFRLGILFGGSPHQNGGVR
jgi:hypothetical protein